MKRLFSLYISLSAVAACAPQSPSPPFAEASPPVQVAVASPPVNPISSANTTSAYDGTYAGVAVEEISAGGALAEAGDGLTTCVNYGVPPALTISNGLAQLQVHDVTFQGYVTPQGALTMRTGLGHKFEGHIDNNQFVLKGRIMERCTYNLSWQRNSLVGVASSPERGGQ
jgi:hypothetical protein